MLNRLLERIGHRIVCRNTRLEFDLDRRGGSPPWLLIRMIDKCTGARYEAIFSPETAENVLAELGRKVDDLRAARGGVG